jgi:PAS domain S-box-containing protein
MPLPPMTRLIVATQHRPQRLLLVTHPDACGERLQARLPADDVVAFTHLDDALRHLAHTDVDCVLLDLELPEAPGTAAVARVLDQCGARRGVERIVREVAADVRASSPERRSQLPWLGAAALVAAFCAQLVLLQHGVGIVLWALFATATVLAWRATTCREQGDRLLASIVEGSADGVFVKDLQGRYQLINDAAARLLDLDRDAVLGRTDEELFGSDASAARRARDQAVVATGETRRYWRTLTVGGAERTVSVVKTPFRDRGGAILGLIGTVRDETVMRQLEEETAGSSSSRRTCSVRPAPTGASSASTTPGPPCSAGRRRSCGRGR